MFPLLHGCVTVPLSPERVPPLSSFFLTNIPFSLSLLSSWTNRILAANDFGSVQVNVANIDPATGKFGKSKIKWIIWLSYFMCSDAVESPDLLLSHPILTLSQMLTHFKHTDKTAATYALCGFIRGHSEADEALTDLVRRQNN